MRTGSAGGRRWRAAACASAPRRAWPAAALRATGTRGATAPSRRGAPSSLRSCGACRRGRWCSARRRAGSSRPAPCSMRRNANSPLAHDPVQRAAGHPGQHLEALPPAGAGRRRRWSAAAPARRRTAATSSSSTSSDARTSAATPARSSSSPPRRLEHQAFRDEDHRLRARRGRPGSSARRGWRLTERSVCCRWSPTISLASCSTSRSQRSTSVAPKHAGAFARITCVMSMASLLAVDGEGLGDADVEAARLRGVTRPVTRSIASRTLP